MKTGILVAEVDIAGRLILPENIKKKLNLTSGDKVQLTLKKIISKKDLHIASENPLYDFTK